MSSNVPSDYHTEVPQKPSKRLRLSEPQSQRYDTATEPPSNELYEPLDVEQKEVRILKLLPNESTKADPKGVLLTVPLARARFAAISYVWGDAKVQRWMTLNGERICIGKSAHTALRYIRKFKKASRVWIDTICINQKDDKERSQQVQLMGEIFGKASPVWLWTGKHTKHSKKFTEIMSSLDMIRDDSIQDLDLYSKDGKYLIGLSNADMESVMEFLDNDIWRRVWILQEIVLSAARSKAILRFGLEGMPYDVFRKGVEALKVASIVTQWLQVGGQAGVFRQQFDLLDEYQSKTLSILSLARLTGSFVHHRATNERDQVYGLLGLFQDVLQLEPDYRKDVVEIYEQATFEMLKQSKSLQPLIYVPEFEDDRAGLASWSLDWRNRRPTSRLSAQLSEHLYGASQTFNPPVWQPHDKTLRVSGSLLFQLGQVRIFTETDGVQELATIRAWMEGQYNIRREQPCESFEEAFHRSLLLDKVILVSPPRTIRFGQTELLEQYETLYDIPDFLDMVDSITEDTSPEWISTISEHDQGIADHLKEVGFSVGPLGELCLLQRKALEGDYIFILAGCSLPMILRSVDENPGQTFHLIGPAYVHRAMDGESLSESPKRMSTGDPDAYDRAFLEIDLV